MSEFKFHAINPFSQEVGYLQIVEGFQIAAKKKPIWLHRKMMQLCFGWKWIDYEEGC